MTKSLISKLGDLGSISDMLRAAGHAGMEACRERELVMRAWKLAERERACPDLNLACQKKPPSFPLATTVVFYNTALSGKRP